MMQTGHFDTARSTELHSIRKKFRVVTTPCCAQQHAVFHTASNAMAGSERARSRVAGEFDHCREPQTANGDTRCREDELPARDQDPGADNG